MSLKKSLKKSIAAFIALTIVYSNCYLCGTGISKVIAEELKEPEIEVKLENSKYVSYQSEEHTGVAMQTSLEFSTNQEENTYLPTSSVQILLNLPELNGYFPEKANVVLSNTCLSTGEKENDKINQNYDSSSGLLKVTYENAKEYSQYVQGMNDKFEIIYIYPAQAYAESEEELSLEYTAEITMSFIDGENLVTTQKTESFVLQEKENRGDILTFGVTELKNEIYKGFMYSNIKNGTAYDTEYKTVSTLCVLDSKLNQEILLEEKDNNFIINSEEETLVSSNGLIEYLATGISRKEFDKILGTNGSIEFYQGEDVISTIKYLEIDDTTKLAIISADGQVNFVDDEEETLIVEYPANLIDLKIKLLNAVSEGYIHFENQKIIKAANDYGCEIEKILGIKTITAVNENMTDVELLMLEPETKVSVILSNSNFSTLQKTNTTLTINLDDTNASTKLFNAPIITVKLPEGLVGGNLSTPKILNGNGLEIEEAYADSNDITIKLKGEQKTYDITNVSGGTSIVMDVENIEFDKTTPTHTSKIEVTCGQGKESIVTSQDVNIISKPGLLMLSTLSNYEDTNNAVTVMNNNMQIVEVKSEGQEREVVNTLDLINNYDEDLANVQIVGRIGYSNEELSSTFDTRLIKPLELNINNAEVYYSANKDASYNDDSWTSEFSTEAKAVKIVLKDNILSKASSIQIKEYVKLQKNIGLSEETYLNWDVEYTYKERDIQENIVLGMATKRDELISNYNLTNETIQTDNGTSIPVSLSIDPVITQDYVHSGQLVTYKIRLTNNGEETLNNITLISTISDKAIYTYYQEVESPTGNYKELVKDANQKQKEWTIEKLESGDTAELEIMLTMSDVQEEQEVINSVSVAYNGKEVSSESKVALKPAPIRTVLTGLDEGLLNVIYKPGDTISYYVKVKNITDKAIKNVKVQYAVPDCLEYIKGGITSYDEFEGYQIIKEGTCAESVFEYNIDNLNSQEEKVIAINAKVKQSSEENSNELKSIAKIYIGNEVYQTNVKVVNIKQAVFEVKLSVDTKGKEILKKDDQVTYIVEVKNIGETSGVINITDSIPEQLDVLNIEYSINGENATVIDYIKQEVEFTNLLLYKNDVLTFKINTEVKNIEVLEETVFTLINKAAITTSELEIDSNEVEIKIEPELKIIEEDKESVEELLPKEEPEEDDNHENIEDLLPEEEPDDNEGEIPPEQPNDNVGEIPPEQSGDNEGEIPPEQPGDNEGEILPEQPDNNGGETPPEQPGDNGEENPPQQPDNNEENPLLPENKEEITYSISGVAWLDSNRNGQKDNDEKLQHSVVVSLVDMTTGNFALDSNGNRIKTTTNSEGRYTFNNVKQGTYIVLFEFDTNTFTVTTYQKEQVSNELNSDVILSNVTIDGQKKLAALTDKIEVKSNNENIDIGLIENATFDLSLNKEITKITVINSKGTETYEYEDGETAKVDLVAKYMNGANVIVNYRFTVKNEGDVAGYVNSLVDNLPTGLEFSSELNENWYKGSDGQLYTTALSGTELKPGETIQIELVLTKNMTEDNAGIFPNNAELERISNLQNIQEKENALENNQSSANLIISIKTGSIAMYTGITTICLAIIGIGTYFIKKKVLNRGI